MKNLNCLQESAARHADQLTCSLKTNRQDPAKQARQSDEHRQVRRQEHTVQNKTGQHFYEGTSLWNKVSSLFVGLSALTSLTATSSTPFMRALYTTPNPPSPSLHFLFSDVRHMLISSLHHSPHQLSLCQQAWTPEQHSQHYCQQVLRQMNVKC